MCLCVLMLRCRVQPEKPKETIMKEIQAVVRQITASVTFLPLLEDPCECIQRVALLFAKKEVTTFNACQHL